MTQNPIHCSVASGAGTSTSVLVGRHISPRVPTRRRPNYARSISSRNTHKLIRISISYHYLLVAHISIHKNLSISPVYQLHRLVGYDAAVFVSSCLSTRSCSFCMVKLSGLTSKTGTNVCQMVNFSLIEADNYRS